MAYQLTPIISFFLASVLGIVTDRLAAFSLQIYFAGWIVGASFALVYRTIIRSIRWKRELLIVEKISILLCVACGFALLHHLDWWMEPEDSLRRRLVSRTPVVVRLEVEQAPQIEPARPFHPLRRGTNKRRVKARVSVSAIQQPQDGKLIWKPVSGQGFLTCQLDSQQTVVLNWETMSAGSILLVRGMGQSMPSASNRAGWSASRHHWNSRFSFSISVKDELDAVKLLSVDTRYMDQLRDAMVRRARNNLRRQLSGKHYRLAAAVLLGDRFELHPQELERFSLGGIVHLIAISGLHVGILALGLLVPLRLLPVPQSFWKMAVLLMIWSYAIVVDARPPVVRASILVSVALLATCCHREVHPYYTLLIAAMLVLLYDPSSMFLIGTQLSFLAVATLMVSKHWLESKPSPVHRLLLRRKWIGFKLTFAMAKQMRATALATTVVVGVAFPLTSSHFHIFSFIGILLNAVLALPIVIGVLSGFLTSILGGIPVLGDVVGTCAHYAFGLIWGLTDWLVQADFGTIWLAGPTAFWCLVVYVLLALATGLIRIPKTSTVVWKLCLGLWILSGMILAPQRLGCRSEVQQLRVVFINVQHGTAVLLEIPDGGVWLYDAGSLTDFRVVGREISEVLWSRGHSRLDGIFVSHADLDHFNAIAYLLDRFDVSQLFMSTAMVEKITQEKVRRRQGPAVRFLAESIRRHAVPIDGLSAGDQLAVGRVNIEIYGPREDLQYETDNDASLVLHLKYQQASLLLPGDVEAQGIAAIVGRPRHTCDVVMLPHHGSVHSEPELFSGWSQPLYAVASTGHLELSERVERSYRRAVQQRGGAILLTSQQKTIEFSAGVSGFDLVED